MGAYSFDVRKIVYQTDSFLFGFTVLGFDPAKGQAMNVSVDKDQIMTVETASVMSFKLSYVAIGKSSKESCTDPSAPCEYQR
jgi:hypothetical protein